MIARSARPVLQPASTTARVRGGGSPERRRPLVPVVVMGLEHRRGRGSSLKPLLLTVDTWVSLAGSSKSRTHAAAAAAAAAAATSAVLVAIVQEVQENTVILKARDQLLQRQEAIAHGTFGPVLILRSLASAQGSIPTYFLFASAETFFFFPPSITFSSSLFPVWIGSWSISA